MSRTTDELVKGVIETDEDNIPDLEPFITVANELVTEVCVDGPVARGDVVAYTSTRLELIERWLAAHFYAVRDPRSKSERAGPVSQEVESDTDLFLSTSKYGQHAMVLDTKGGLARLNNALKTGKAGSRPAVRYMGTVPSTTQQALDAD